MLKTYQNVNQETLYGYTQNKMLLTSVGFDTDNPIYCFFELEFFNLSTNSILDNVLLRINYVYSNDNNAFDVYLTDEIELTDSNRYTIKNQIEAGTLLPIEYGLKPTRIGETQYQYLDIKLSKLNKSMSNVSKVVFVIKAKSTLQQVQINEFYKETNYCIANVVDVEYVSPSQSLNKITLDGNFDFLVDPIGGNLLTEIHLFPTINKENPINLFLGRNQRILKNGCLPFNFSLNYSLDIEKEVLDNDVKAVIITDVLGNRNRYFKIDGHNENDYIQYFNHNETGGIKYYNDQTGSCLYFSSTGEYTGIIKIYDKNYTLTTIHYNSESLSQISSIVKQNGRGIYFTWSNSKLIYISHNNVSSTKDIQITYNSSGYIQTIRYIKLNLLIGFTYSSNLIVIDYVNSDNLIKEYALTFVNGLLSKVESVLSSKTVNLQYVSQQLTLLSLLNGDNILESLTFQYSSTSTRIINKLSKSKIVYFDRFKRCIREQDQYNNFLCYEYYGSTDMILNKTKINPKKKMFTNGSFDTLDTYNRVLGWNITTNSAVSTYNIVEKEYGKCLQVSYKNSGMPFTISQKIYDETGNLSYIKGKICHSSFYYQNLVIKVEGTYVLNNTEYTFSNSITEINTTKWFDFALNLNIPTGAKNITATLSFIISGTYSCTIYFDEVETNLDIHSIYQNLIKNNNMDEINTSNVPTDWHFSNKISGEGVITLSSYDQNNGSRTLKLIGNSVLRSIYQNVLVDGLENETYYFSLNYKINSIMNYFKPFVKIYYKDGEIESVYLDIERSTNTNFIFDKITFITKKAFSKFVVGVEYLGTGNVYVDNFRLIKTNDYCEYKYDDRSNITSIESSLNDATRLIYNKKNMIDTILTKDGLKYFFEYNNNELSSIKCSNGINIDYSYDTNGYRTSTSLSRSGEMFSISNEKDPEGYVTQSFDEYNYETKYTLDTLKNIIQVIYPNNLTIGYGYTKYNELETITENSTEQTIVYNSKSRQIEEVTSGNGNVYTFDYDEYGNVLNVKLNDLLIFENTYLNIAGESSNLISSSVENNNTYNYIYDNQLRVIEVKLNNSKILGFTYDDSGNVYKILDGNDNVVKQFEYNHNNQIVNVVYGLNYSRYYYDNLGDIQKENKYIGSHCSYDYDYSYERNKYTFNYYTNKMISLYNHDVIIGNRNFVGVNGLTTAINTLRKEEKYYNSVPYYSFDDESDYVSLKLDTVNQKMNKLINRNDYELFKENFRINKKIAMWFRPNSIGKLTSLLKFQRYEENVGQVIAMEVRVNSTGYIEYYQKGKEEILYTSSSRVNVNKWNMLVINMFFDEINSKCVNRIILNGVIDDAFLDEVNIKLCNRLLVGYQDKLEEGDTSTSSILSYCPFDICYLSIGDNEFKLTEYKGIYMDGLNLIENTIINTEESVQYAKTGFNDSYEVISLNGNLDSNRNLSPYIIENKSKSSKYYLDPIKNKHCLALLNFARSRFFGILKLGYDLNLSDIGCLSIKFKLYEDSVSSYRHIFSFNDKESNTQKMSVYVNNNKINVNDNGSITSFSSTVSNNIWYTFTMFFNGTSFVFYLNNNLLGSMTMSSTSLLNHCISYLGGTSNGITLNGLMEMFVIKRTSTSASSYDSVVNLLLSENMVKHMNCYDNLNRVTSKDIKVGNNIFTQSYTYNKTRVSEECLLDESRRYTYDCMGNVIKIERKAADSETYFNLYEYEYDLQGRIDVEKNYETNRSIKYNYENGNLKSTNIKDLNGNVISNTDFKHNFSDDRLTSIILSTSTMPSVTISYNGHYPSSIYMNNKTRAITYEGKRIKTYGNNEYFYNEEGVRIKKVTETNKTHEYIVEGSKILYEKIYTTGTTTTLAKLYYNYNQYGELVSVEYNNKLYFYIKDILGNIVKIIDETGNNIVKYSYNSWGVVTKTTLSSNEYDYKLAQYNPFMYKGYYYDVETGLFMMGQRYYSPELCRFIQPDDIEYLEPESINGLNLYCYCYNNPIMYSDPNGHFPILCTLLFLGGLGALTSIASQAVTDIVYGNEFDINNYLIAAGAGFIGGLCYAIPIPVWNGVIASAVTSGLTTAGQMIYSGEDYSAEEYAIMIAASAVVGGATSYLFGKATSSLSYFADADFFLNNFYAFASSGPKIGPMLPNGVVNELASYLLLRGTVVGTISGLAGSIFKDVPDKSRAAWRLYKLGFNPWDSFRYAFF